MNETVEQENPATQEEREERTLPSPRWMPSSGTGWRGTRKVRRLRRRQGQGRAV